MRRLPFPLICLLAAVLFAAAANATEVYRCTGANGVSYQDTPCAADQKQGVMHLVDAPPPPPPPASAPADDTVSATPPTDAAPPPPALPSTPAPDFYLCTATDGSHYVSEDGVGRRSAVPYAMLGDSGQTLAQAYGGPNGIGVSAPGLRTPPTIPASKSPLASSYVWVVDECHHADAQEACAYLRNELDKVDGKLRRAFSDTQAQLRQEQATLRERLRGC
jgi:hypothetical protein